MSKLVSIERQGSAFARFVSTKGFLVILLLATVILGAVILALIANQAISQRFVDYFNVAFGIGKDVANRYSLGVVFSISVLAYLILMARGMNTTIGTETIIEDKQKKDIVKHIGQYDFYFLGGSILLIEVVALIIMGYENYKAIEKDKTMSNHVIGVLVMFQILLGMMLRTTMNLVRTAQDTASKNIETETELAHQVASESAKSALNPTASASKPLLGKMPNTGFEIRKSKIA